MSRPLFCHELELLRQFARHEFEGDLRWNDLVISDEWHDDRSIGKCFNSDVRHVFRVYKPPNEIKSCVMQIHPGRLEPAVFVSIDPITREVYSWELLQGERTTAKCYQASVNLIITYAREIGGDDFAQELRWWRVFRMFDRLFFLVSNRSFEAMRDAERISVSMPSEETGELTVYYAHGQVVGLDGWIVSETGFGDDAEA